MSGPIEPLIRDFCCRANMLWGTKLDSTVEEPSFLAALGDHGFSQAPGVIPGLHVLDHQSGHRLVYVTRTGRLQLRLDPLTRHEERVAAAHELYQVVRRATFAALGDVDPGPPTIANSTDAAIPTTQPESTRPAEGCSPVSVNHGT